MNTPTHHNPEPDDDFEGELRQRLQSTPIDLPHAAGPHAAADRAHERSRRRRSGVVAAAAVALVGGLAAPTLLDRDGDEGVNTDIAAPIDANGVELDWQVHDDGLAQVLSADEGGDGFYALSTAPGTRWQDYPDGNAPRALYRWSDRSWQPVELGDEDPNVARVSERDGALYGLSTAADTGSPIGSVSTDGGENWSSVPLGSIEPPSTTVNWGMAVQLNLTSTADTTVGVVSTRFTIPADDLFPELSEESTDGRYYTWLTADDGVQLIEVTEGEIDRSGASASTIPPDADPEALEALEEQAAGRESTETVVRTIPWSDLGVRGPEAIQSQITTYQADGASWTPMSDGPGVGASAESLVSTDSGILFQTANYGEESPTSQVFHSADGSAWRPVSTPAAEWGQTVLAPNGNLLHIAGGDDGLDAFTVSVSTDLGGSWSPIDIASIAPEIGDPGEWMYAHSGPLGVGLMVHGTSDSGDGPSQLLFSTDLQSWTTTDLDALTPDATPHLNEVFIGTDHIVIQAAGPSDPDDDEPGPSATLVATPVR